MRTIFCALAAAGGMLAFGAPVASAATCESLSSLSIAHGVVTLARPVGTGEFTPPAGRAGRAAANQNPFTKLRHRTIHETAVAAKAVVDPKTLNFDADVTRAGTGHKRVFDASNPDMGRFTRRGGKLIMYQGWAEPGIPPRNLVRYYEQILQKTAGANDAERVFMIPGMGHCGGGNGTNTFDMVAALDAWRERGEVPDHVNASRVRDGKVDRTRPLCAWPQTAKYKGSGSIEDASSFVCR